MQSFRVYGNLEVYFYIKNVNYVYEIKYSG